MTPEEFSNQFDIYYNNITSNLAPGLTEYEKSVFLTKALDEIIKNYFTATSKGNSTGLGFDDSAKRLADFSVLMKTAAGSKVSGIGNRIDLRSVIYEFPSDVFIVINEVVYKPAVGTIPAKYFLVIPLRYDDYTRLMSKPFKRPRKNEAWRLINSGIVEGAGSNYTRYVEIVTGPDYDNVSLNYEVRYVRRPKPIILGNIDGLTINGYTYNATPNEVLKRTDGVCELDPILHEDVLLRAVELAKVAWTASGNDNVQAVLLTGVRSE